MTAIDDGEDKDVGDGQNKDRDLSATPTDRTDGSELREDKKRMRGGSSKSLRSPTSSKNSKFFGASQHSTDSNFLARSRRSVQCSAAEGLASIGLMKRPEVQGRKMVSRNSPKFDESAIDYNCDNTIKTTRFGKYTWLGESIWYQFRRAANQYFLVITVLTCMEFSPKMAAPAILTFAGVLLWTACKDFYEDLQRATSDRKENEQIVLVQQKDKSYVGRTWEEVMAHDIVQVRKNETFPADVILLGTSFGSEGHSYIDTKNLDGETNLKYKITNQQLLTYKDYDDIKFTVEPPHENMAVFKGSVEDHKMEAHPLMYDNIILRGCVLRNTDWVIGFVAYAGRDTKAMLNSREAPAKAPNMQTVLNKLLYGLFLTLFLVVLGCSICSQVWESDMERETAYLQAAGDDGKFDTSVGGFFIKFGVYIVTFSHLIPMSLYVALEITKLVLAYFLMSDPTMVDQETGTKALARNSDLIEELGQVEIVFSDKTGTLTQNKMIFVRASCDGVVYGPPDNQALETMRHSMKSTYASPGSPPMYHLEGDTQPHRDMFELNKKSVLDYFLLLAVCHAVVIDPETKTYQGSSPDEVALVQGAAAVGVKLTSIQFNDVVIELANGEKREYTIHERIEFDSDRKRMTLVVENKHEKKMEVLCKGADMMVIDRLKKNKREEPMNFETEAAISSIHLKRFASDGLRTLVCGKKVIKDLDPESDDMKSGCWYDGWKERFKKASVLLDGREEAIASLAESIEFDFEYVGITAVEDMLQEGVADTIALLREAGIRVWVLTGDKVETAIDIGYSCRLLDKSMNVMKISDLHRVEDVEPALQSVLEAIEQGTERVGIAVDGFSMTTIITSGREDLSLLFFKVVMNVDAVICCRVAPKQKAFVVKIVRENLPSLITASIGDGANDVAMIQEAHVGIGIRGVEGTQAVQASDFAISQFRFLQGLFLDHGRCGYRRVATFICYYFYKNIALVTVDIFWTGFGGYSGQIVFPTWFTTNYNALWTSFPCIFSFAYDADVSNTVARGNPYLYAAGPNHVFFNPKVFVVWVLLACWHGMVTFFIPFFAYSSGPYDSSGVIGGFWWVSILMFSIMVTVVNMKLALITVKWRAISLGVLIFSELFYLVCLFIMEGSWFTAVFQSETTSLGSSVFGSATGVWLFIAVTAMALFPDVLIECFNVIVRPTPLQVQMYHERAAHKPTGFFGFGSPIEEDKFQIRIAPSRPGKQPLPSPVSRVVKGGEVVAPLQYIGPSVSNPKLT